MAQFLTDDELDKLGAAPVAPSAPVAPTVPDGPLTDADMDALSAAPEAEGRALNMIGNGLTFGLLPRATAAIKSGSISGPEYEAARDAEWQKDDAYREQNPWTSVALEVGGSLPTMFIPGLGAGRIAAAANQGGNVAQNLSRGQRAARTLGFGQHVGTTGAEAGALGAKATGLYAGLGSREEDASGRLTDAVTALPLGYVGGRAGDAIGGSLTNVAEELYDAARVGGNANRGALTGIRRGLERDGVTTDDLRQAMMPDMGRMQTQPEALEAALRAFGQQTAQGATPAAARRAATQAYTQAMRAAGSTAADATLASHVGRALNRYNAANDIPLAIDEAARLTGSRGQNSQWTRRAAQNSPGEGRERLFDDVLGRQEDVIPAVRARAENAVGDGDALGARQALVQRNRGNENALYAATRANEVPFDLSDVFHEYNATEAFRAGRAGEHIAKALDAMRARPMADGRYPRHTIDTYIQARGKLNDLIEDSFDTKVPGVKRPTSATGDLIELKRKMDAIVGEANPRWQWANDITRGGRAVVEALDEGAKVRLDGTDRNTKVILNRVSTINNRISELQSAARSARRNGNQPSMEAMAELNHLVDQRDAYRMGFSEVLDNALTKLGDTHDVAKLFLKGGQNAQRGPRRVVEVMMGEDAPAFMDAIRRAQITGTTYKNQFNSQTTPLRDAIDEAKQESRVTGMMRALGYWTNPQKIFSDVGEAIGNRLFSDRNAEIARRLTMTSANPDEFFGLLRELDNLGVGRGRAFNQEGLNLYSAPGLTSGAFGANRAQEMDRQDDEREERFRQRGG